MKKEKAVLVQLKMNDMSVVKDLMFDILNHDPYFLSFNKDKNLNFKNISENKTKLDLPYLDLSKVNSYLEGDYLYIKYENPEDERRKTFSYKFYVGDSDVSVKYENGFLIIERKQKEKEKRYIPIN